MIRNVDQPPKPLLVVTGFLGVTSPGGSEFNVRFSRALQSLHVEPRILVLRSVHPRRPLLRRSDISGFDVTVASVLLPGPAFRGTGFHVLRPVLSRLAGIMADIDVLHGVGGTTALACASMSDAFKTPFILQFIGSDINTHLERNSNIPLFRSAVTAAAALRFNATHLRTTLRKRQPSTDEGRVVYRGIDVEQPAAFTRGNPQPTILYLGGFPNDSFEKGGDLLLQAIDRLELGVRSAPRFRLGGPGRPPPHALQRPNVEYLGALAHDCAMDELRRATFLVVPSRKEGVPNVLFEAVASGTPLICSDLPGIREVLPDDVCCIYFRAGEVESLRAALDRASALTSAEREAMARRAFERIKLFSHRLFVQSYVETYSQVLAR